jgi:hypothetical protein
MRLPKTLLLLMAATQAQELEQIRLEFLVDHLQETMADAWDVTGTVAELVETSVPDHQDDLLGGAEALRKAIFASLRMLAGEETTSTRSCGAGTAPGTMSTRARRVVWETATRRTRPCRV